MHALAAILRRGFNSLVCDAICIFVAHVFNMMVMHVYEGNVFKLLYITTQFGLIPFLIWFTQI